MKYVADYKTTPALKAEIVKAARELIANSFYYSMHREGGYGSGLVDRRSSEGQWKGFWLFGSFDEFPEWEDVLAFEPTWKWAKEVQFLSWTTSGGNTEKLWISDSEIRLERVGRRHGITNFFDFLQEVKPSKVEVYESERTDVSPWDKDLLPDLSKHPELGIIPLLGKVHIFGQNPEHWSDLRKQRVLDGVLEDGFSFVEYRALKAQLGI